jgi:hypothetical protein
MTCPCQALLGPFPRLSIALLTVALGKCSATDDLHFRRCLQLLEHAATHACQST